jgi:hypothetical protein
MRYRFAMPPPTFPAPPSLDVLLKAAGFRARLLVERADGGPLSDAERAAVADMLEAHGDGDDVSDDEICEALADAGLIPGRRPAGAATGTDGR